MALPGNGKTISASLINVELKRSASAAFSMGGADERKLAGKTTGAISLSDFWGKSSYTPPAVKNPLSPIPDATDERHYGQTSTASFSINGDGTWSTTGSEMRQSGTWLTAGSAADVEVKITPSSNSLWPPSTNAGDWRAAAGARCSMSSTHRYAATAFTVQFRNKLTGAILSTTTGCRLVSISRSGAPR